MRVPVIELRGAARTFDGQPPVHALAPTDLQIRAGDHVAIVGPSGSGKSTLLNLIGLLDRPSAGAYLLEGDDVADLAENTRAAVRGTRIGFVFQAFHLIDHRTATENVMIGLLYRGLPYAERRDRARRVLRSVGLGHRCDALPATMSGGERQRVAIARALIGEPALLLCDEPTGNLDSRTTEDVLCLLDELNAQGITVVVITHEDDVARRARRVLRLRDGHLDEVLR